MAGYYLNPVTLATGYQRDIKAIVIEMQLGL